MANILPSGLIILTLMSCCGTSGFSAEKDCGISIGEGAQCFSDAAYDGCSPAKAFLYGDMPVVARMEGEYDSTACRINVQAASAEELKAAFRQDLPGEDLDAEVDEMVQEPFYQSLKGKSAACVVPLDELEYFMAGDVYGYCSGPLLDALEG